LGRGKEGGGCLVQTGHLKEEDWGIEMPPVPGTRWGLIRPPVMSGRALFYGRLNHQKPSKEGKDEKSLNSLTPPQTNN